MTVPHLLTEFDAQILHLLTPCKKLFTHWPILCHRAMLRSRILH